MFFHITGKGYVAVAEFDSQTQATKAFAPDKVEVRPATKEELAKWLQNT